MNLNLRWGRLWVVGVWLLVGAVGVGTNPLLQEGSRRNVIVWFRDSTEELLTSVREAVWESREAKLGGLVRGLRGVARGSQGDVVAWLNQNPHLYTFYSSLWITNQVYVRGALPEALTQLRTLRGVKLITDEEVYDLVEPVEVGEVTSGGWGAGDVGWNVQLIQAKEAVELLLKGGRNETSGWLRVGTIDTGVRGTHEALRDSYLGDGGWLDPYGSGNRSEEPFDDHGHGTHTTGILVGGGGIGVFPHAKWLSCKGCNGAKCTTYELQRCGQFMACPGFDDEKDEAEWDCSKAPQVVSSSWNWVGVAGSPYYDGVIAAWHVAGIVPFFSAGNSGPSCSTINSPADRDVIAVGATTPTDHLSTFSSLGPSIESVLKPDLSAPGSGVISAAHTSDDAYVSMSGTSMASPCAAGVAGILLAFDPSLTFREVLNALQGGAERGGLQSSGMNCYGLRDNVFPNFMFGYGRVNALRSAEFVLERRKTQ